jgi:protein tyrosine phosphatase (PTP) superfamily phosphohydrolase (DUF442 family)
MQVSVMLPSDVPSFVSERGCRLPQDYILQADSAEAATLMAKLLVDTYVPTIFTADATEKVPACGIVAAPQIQAPHEEDKARLPVALQLQAKAGYPLAAPTVVPPAAEAVPDQVEQADLQSQCCLENCDRVLENLYIGGVEAVLDSERLAEQGIRAVVCCNRELEFPTSKFLPEVEYYRVDVEDMGREPIELFLPEATEFIHSQLQQDRPVLVHCKAGVSRSASVVLAYLMEYHSYSLHEAFLLMLRHRPTITPNPGFMEQLRSYEKEKCGVNIASIDMHRYLGWFQAEQRRLEPNLQPDC